MSTVTGIKGLIFDAYGTLFDVHSVVEAAREITSDPQVLSRVWRQKQLEYTWLRSLMGRYEDFWKVTEAALRFAVRQLDVAANDAEIKKLMEAYLSLRAYPDVAPAFERLRGRPLAILSNGSPKMLEAATRSSGLAPHLSHVISVDLVKTFKPSPAVYALGAKIMGLAAGEILFVSSNGWDAVGATAFGYRVGWCNRGKAPAEELGMVPDLTVERLDEIPALLE